MRLAIKIVGVLGLFLVVIAATVYIYLLANLHSSANVFALIDFILYGPSSQESLLTNEIVLREKDDVIQERFVVEKYCGYNFTLTLLPPSNPEDTQGGAPSSRPDYKGVYLPVSLDIYKNTDDDGLVPVYSYQGAAHSVSPTTFRLANSILDEGEYFLKLRLLAVQDELLAMAARLTIHTISKSVCPDRQERKEDDLPAGSLPEFVREGSLFPDTDILAKRHLEKILAGEIILGMTPYEARLAGGSFEYEVKPDRTVWPENYNPLAVLYWQSAKPDNSVIEMTFRNSTQFDSPQPIKFTVLFRQGRAAKITRENN